MNIASIIIKKQHCFIYIHTPFVLLWNNINNRLANKLIMSSQSKQLNIFVMGNIKQQLTLGQSQNSKTKFNVEKSLFYLQHILYETV